MRPARLPCLNPNPPVPFPLGPEISAVQDDKFHLILKEREGTKKRKGRGCGVVVKSVQDQAREKKRMKSKTPLTVFVT